MKSDLQNIIKNSTIKLYSPKVAGNLLESIEVFAPKEQDHGDYSTNIAMILAKLLKEPPRKIAENISQVISSDYHDIIDKIEVAGPGFINFFLKKEFIVSNLVQIGKMSRRYGESEAGAGQKVLIEFVSANPTGYLHIGHARNAVVGDTISKILNAVGYEVTKEFYINDAGRQIDMLGISVFLRYKSLFGADIEIPEDGYQGDYVSKLAEEIKFRDGDKFIHEKPDNVQVINYFKDYSKNRMLEEIKNDLIEIGIEFDNWFSEYENLHSDVNETKIKAALKILRKHGAVEDRENAVWFKATEYGDSQDWVLIKSDGSPTYFIADIAYHIDKIFRGYKRLINIWGADHHSHVARLKSAIKATGEDQEILKVLLIQFVRLVREGEEISMSKRSGQYVTLREVVQEVGTDVLRYFMLMRSSDTHLDFDLDLAKRQSNENPVYYIQYAHARINSIFQKAGEFGLKESNLNLDLLDEYHELEIIKILISFPDVIEDSATNLAAHKLCFYLQNLASQFHVYYNNHRIVTENTLLSEARLYLIKCISIVLNNGLNLMGIKAPERM